MIESLKRKILENEFHLLEILRNPELYKPEDVLNIYRDYLKLYVQLDELVPEYNAKWPYNNNCYFYALNLPTPNIFNIAYSKVTNKDWGIHTSVGLISNTVPADGCIENKKQLLELVKADLETLKIKTFRYNVRNLSDHGGYKIAIFYRKGSLFHHDDFDYHFVRQNKCGKWSGKAGYTDEFIYSDSPFDFAADDEEYGLYEYVETLELVKPTIRR